MVELGADAGALEAKLRDEFPKATLQRVDAGRVAEVPLDLVGTAFQKKVWDALMKIPAGTTRSYAELATQLGQPKSARAVASACARNKVAVLVPCHRVVRGDGSLGGYRWGLPVKQQLLQREAARA